MKTDFKKIIPFFLFLLILAFSSGHCFKSYKKTSGTVEEKVTPAVIVDAGHGGFDGGAVALDGTEEKEINLLIALKLQKLLSDGKYKVIMTRTGDYATNDTGDKIRSKKRSDMQNRLALMEENPRGIFVSIHLNKYTTSSVSGAQVFYSPNDEFSKTLAEELQKNFAVLQPQNKRTVKKATSSAYLLYNAKIPAVIVECGFLSNKEELELLKTDDYQQKTAECIKKGIDSYFKSFEKDGYSLDKT